MEKNEADQLIDFLNKSPTPFHAVNTVAQELTANSFTPLTETTPWKLLPGHKYYFTRNHSTVFAFSIPPHYVPGSGFNVVAAHTDSPVLRVRPISKRESKGYIQISVETYGGGLWHTWFDRDLGVAGRVIVRVNGQLEHRLVNIKRPILRIPNLAIHLTKGDERTKFEPNTQDHLGYAILATKIKTDLEATELGASGVSHPPLLLRLLADELHVKMEDISDFELMLTDVQPSTRGGALNEFVFSGRLDNLCMSFCAVNGLIESVKSKTESHDKRISLVALFDDEEIGSQSAYGAASNMMQTILKRISEAVTLPTASGGAEGTIEREFANTFLISADMAHAVHPNYASRHEDNFQPKMHGGPVIKYNANQRYATTAITATLFKELCKAEKVPFQEFEVRNDSPCGSTIGPILSANCGVRTVDIGVAQLSMHSIREMCGAGDVHEACKLFRGFFGGNFTILDEGLKVDQPIPVQVTK